MDCGTHVRMVDPVTATHPGPRGEDRTLGSHDLSVNEQADARQNHTLDNFKMASKTAAPMQFMILMIPAVYQGGKKVDPGFEPDAEKMAQMDKFNQELSKALTVISINGLRPLSNGARVAFGKGKPIVTDSPLIESKEVLGGYWMVEASSKEELVKWAQRCPADPGDVIEIREIWNPA